MARVLRLRLRLALGLVVVIVVGCTSASPAPSATSEASPPTRATPSAASAEPSVEPSRAPAGWRQLTVSGGPAAREDHTWTADGEGAMAYLFGGRDQAGYGAFAELWAYDLATDSWEQRAGGPPARFGHNAAWVPGVGLVIFAGQNADSFLNDLWAYDPATDTWRELPGGGDRPVPRYGSCAALGPDGRLWISHGFTSEGARFSDTRAYDFGAQSWTNETPVGDLPVVRCLHACWWTDADRFTLYAGQTNGITAIGDRWELTPGPRPGTNTWQQVAPGAAPPPDRNLYAAARWGEATLVFGGQAVDGGYLADTWLLSDDGGATTVALAAGPSPRAGAEFVADPARDRVLLFGGTASGAVVGDLWELTPP